MNDSKSWDFLGSRRAGKHAKNYNKRIAREFRAKNRVENIVLDFPFRKRSFCLV